MRVTLLPRLALALHLSVSCLVVARAADEEAGQQPAPKANPSPAPAADKDKEKKTAPPAPMAPRKTEGMKSSDGVFILVEQLADALRFVPRAVILKPEKYQELLDEIERLKAQARPNRATPPSSCSLKGKIEGNVALVQATFEFATDQANALVYLACAQASVTSASLDGHTPSYRPDLETITVQVEKPGDHKLTLEMVVPLTARGGGPSLELDLPRATTTALELELPAGSRDIRVAGREGDQRGTFKDNRFTANLGAVARLDLTWKDAKAPGGTTPLLSADGRILVRIDERLVTSTAELTLGAQGGPAKEWRLQVPAGAEVKVAVADQLRVQPVESADTPTGSLRTIRLKEPTLDPLRVTVSVRTPLPKPGTPLAIGPFNVLGAARQAGTVLVSNAVADLRPQLAPRGDLVRRVIADDELRGDPALLAAFSYRNVVSGTPSAAPPGPAIPWLDLEVENVRGLIETHIAHQLKLQRDAAGKLFWRVATTIDATPIRTGADHLEVLMPPDCVYDKERGPRPAELVKNTEFDENTRIVHFLLATDSPKPFQLRFEGTYRLSALENGQRALALPVPRDTRDRGGLVTVVAPEDIELTLPEPGNFTLEPITHEPQRAQWRSDRIPDKVDIGWKPYRPDARAANQIDLTLNAREGQVRQQLQLQFTRATPTQISLRVPEAIASRLTVVDGGTLTPADAAGPTRIVQLRGATGKEHTLTLEYSFPIHARPDGQPLSIPLVTPDTLAGGDTKVRVWSEPGILPLPPGGPWSELNVDEVKGRDRLPVLVLRSQRPDAPLALQLGEPTGTTSPTILVERALVRATILEGGGQSYHVSYLIRQLATAQLDLELPAPIPGLGLRVALAGKKLDWEVPDGAAGRVARLRVSSDLVRGAAVLDVWYQLPIDRTGGNLVRSVLQPPILRGAPEQVPFRWQIVLPSGWVPLAPEGGPGGDRSWSLQRKLLTPRLAISNLDLERWFAGQEAPARTGLADASGVPSHVCWRNGPEPIAVTHVPQAAWFLVCSLGVLLVGRGLARLSLPAAQHPLSFSPWFLPTFALLCLGMAAIWLLYPTLLAAILFGGQIGAVVLLLWLAIDWVLRERFRRQIVFLPSFSRTRTGSSLQRPAGSSVRKRGEPSTVDAPPPGSSVAAAEELP